MYELAIDFGTTNTTAATLVDGRPQQPQKVRLSSKGDQMPSCVLRVDDVLRAGDAAHNSAKTEPPEHYLRTPKPFVGHEEVLLGDHSFPIHTVIATVLRVGAERVASQNGGQPPQRVRLTHPDTWSSSRREVLLLAANAADLPHPVLVTEPVAAATWYLREAQRQHSVEHGIAVYDIGGGTVDVAVLLPSADGLVVAATDGEDEVAGERFDRELTELVLDELVHRGHGDVADEYRAEGREKTQRYRTMVDEVRLAKETLSTETKTKVAVPLDGDHIAVTVTRRGFEERIEALVQKGVDAMQRALRDCDVDPTQLDGVYLVGGSSEIPLVGETLGSQLGVAPARLYDPKLVTAQGALLVEMKRPNTVLPPPPPPPPPPPVRDIAALAKGPHEELVEALSDLDRRELRMLLRRQRHLSDRKAACRAILERIERSYGWTAAGILMLCLGALFALAFVVLLPAFGPSAWVLLGLFLAVIALRYGARWTRWGTGP